MPSTLKWINVALRALMELGIVVALGYWGCKTGSGTGAKILLASVRCPSFITRWFTCSAGTC